MSLGLVSFVVKVGDRNLYLSLYLLLHEGKRHQFDVLYCENTSLSTVNGVIELFFRRTKDL